SVFNPDRKEHHWGNARTWRGIAEGRGCLDCPSPRGAFAGLQPTIACTTQLILDNERRPAMGGDRKRSSEDRRSNKERRSGIDTRSEEEKRLIGERRSKVDRRFEGAATTFQYARVHRRPLVDDFLASLAVHLNLPSDFGSR